MKRDRFGTGLSGAAGTQFWRRPALDRRVFFQHLGAAVSGSFLMPGMARGVQARSAEASSAKADNVIFILMAGGPSHVDTFDLKEGAWTPPAFEPTSYGDVRWPRGLMPKMAEHMGSTALLRSAEAWAVVHGICQTWVQIGRNPLAGTSKIAPHIGSVVSRELRQATSDKTLPSFIALNAGDAPGQGYFEAEHAPFKVTPGGTGLGNTAPPAYLGQAGFERRYNLLLDLDAGTRASGAMGQPGDEMVQFNLSARSLMFNSAVDSVFTFSTEERARYGTTSLGNACLTARNLLRANLGARFIQITTGGWDNHSGIYTGMLNASNASSGGRKFDEAVGTMLDDLKADGSLDRTLVVAMGEFGRTVGSPNTRSGRDHFMGMSVYMAGAGIKGPKAIGGTDAEGRNTLEPGWSAGRHIYPEDVEATIYAALGIDWTKAYHDDPLGRGFYLLPNNQGLEFKPVQEIWG
ncbi:MAG TPA: DUF1501 domain-containing protein [Bryobacteraceae bacterium]|nr:DUF1501 domain-containing protein [Bryobacteraceae bacterium]